MNLEVFNQIIRHAIFALCIATSPLAAQEIALPPLADDVAARFTAIGRLGQAGFRVRQSCTATLIAPDLVVTAAHCVSSSGTSQRVFVAGWSRGDYIASRETKSEIRHPAYALRGTHTPRNDIALIILQNPIQDVTPIPLGDDSAVALAATAVALLGYHRQTPHLLSGDFDCPVTDYSRGLFQVGCRVINGNSGSPLLNQTEDGAWQIVGIVSSQRGAATIAVAIPDWLKSEVASHLQLTLE